MVGDRRGADPAIPAAKGSHIAVVTADVLAATMAGPAIRAWNIAHVLAEEHEVELVSTSARECDVSSADLAVRNVSTDELEEIEEWAHVIVVQGFLVADHPFLMATSKVLVIDLYDPLHLEQLELNREESEPFRSHMVSRATAALNQQLRRGDFFICATTKQRDFWLGQMSALGRINHLTYDDDPTLRALIAVVPFGLEDDPPRHTRQALKGVVPGIAENDEVVLWAGGIYNRFDPLTLVRSVDLLRRRRPRVRLYFMGIRHPNPDVPEMAMASSTRQLADELGLTGVNVFFNEEWAAYDDRQNFLLEADVGASTHLSHLETVFSFRTRILDYIWAGLPIVATEGDAFAELIHSAQLGFTVPVGDVKALEAALFRALEAAQNAAGQKANFDAVRPDMRWSVVLRPLVQFCRAPRRAPDLIDPTMAVSLSGWLPDASSASSWRRKAQLVLASWHRGGESPLLATARSRIARSLRRQGMVDGRR